MLNSLGERWRMLELDKVVLGFVIALNVAIFAACWAASGGPNIQSGVLLRNGAITLSSFRPGEMWRLLASGFLHANLLHIASNMVCLVIFAGPLLRRVKAAYFVLIYLTAIMGGAVVSILLHTQPFYSIGASGGVSGVLGAIACLFILNKTDVPAQFLVSNIVISVAQATTVPNIDWMAHVGGFAGGFIACAVLDLVEHLNGLVLRCKFPEFVKLNGLVILGAASVLALYPRAVVPLAVSAQAYLSTVAFAVACLVLIKSTDLLLSMRRGLAVVIAGLAVGNAALGAGLIWALMTSWGQACRAAPLAGLQTLCVYPAVTLAMAAIAGLLLTLAACAIDFRRSLNDVGFVVAGLTAQRRRVRGL